MKESLIISFSYFQAHSSPFFRKWRILKIRDIVDMQRCLLRHSFLKDELPKSCEIIFKKCSDIYSSPTKSSMSEFFYMLCFRSTKDGMNSISNTCIHTWNSLTQVTDSPSKLQIDEIKERLFNHYIDNYQLPLLLNYDILSCIVELIVASPLLPLYLLFFFLKLHNISKIFFHFLH